MQKTPFIWLGSKRSRKWNVNSEVRYLDKAAAAGLPVPAGGILLSELYDLLLAENVYQVDGQTLSIPDSAFFHETLFQAVRFPKLDKPVLLRSMFCLNGEQDLNVTLPEFIVSNIDTSAPQQLSQAVSNLLTLALRWESENVSQSSLRRDMMIMEMIPGRLAGHVHLAANDQPDQLSYTTAGEDAVTTIAKLGSWRGPDRSLPAYAQRLQLLLRGLRRTLGKEEWQVEWIDDGRVCWLTAVHEPA